MGYERNDRGYGRDADRSDTFRGNDRYDAYGQDRGFFERAGDEVRSWFGDEEAERRRRYDERFDERYDRDAGRGPDVRGTAYRPAAYGGGDYPRYDRSNRPDRYATDRGGYEPGAGRAFDGGRSDAPGGYRPGGGGEWREREYQALYGTRSGADRDTRRDDPHGYHSWRDQQISAFDRDYDEYRRENHSRFASEFSAWRENRQTQRQSLQKAQEHQEVVGSDGVHVGKVDHIRGDRILLTKTDPDAGSHHHSIPSSWIQSVDDKVHLSKTAEQAQQAWRDEESNSGLFGNQDPTRPDDRGASDLNRSFSGTY